MESSTTIGKTSKYVHLAGILSDRIKQGILQPDSPLPTLRTLMADYGYSLATVTRAIEILERRSLVTRVHGKGIFVSGPPFRNGLQGEDDRRPGFAGLGVASLTVGVLCKYPQRSDPAEMWWAAILRGVEAALARDAAEGTRLRLVPLTSSPPESIVEQCSSEGINALLILGGWWGGGQAAGLCRAVRRHRMPVVMAWNGIPRPLCVNSVDVDNRRGIYEAVEHLAGLGHRRVVFVGCDSEQSWAQERLRAFTEIADCLGLEAAPAVKVPLGARERKDEDALRALNGVSAVVTANDDLAAWLINTAGCVGKVAPRDFSVIGFDDDPLYRHLEMTTVHVDMERLGSEAARLLGRLAAEPTPGTVQHLQLAGRLVVRHTTGPAH